MTKSEIDILSKFKAQLSNDLKKKLVVASYLAREIECQFGVDVFEFMMGFHCGTCENINYHVDNPSLLSYSPPFPSRSARSPGKR